MSYSPLISDAAARTGLPYDFLFRLLRQESGLRADAVSPKGALGIAQFMPATALERGLTDPFDPSQAVIKAAELLRDHSVRFGNLGLAAAAYNAGPGRVERWLAGASGMPQETRDYVQIITGRGVEEWVPAGRWAALRRETGAAPSMPGASPLFAALPTGLPSSLPAALAAEFPNGRRRPSPQDGPVRQGRHRGPAARGGGAIRGRALRGGRRQREPMSRPANLLTGAAPALRLGLLHADRIEAHRTQGRAAGSRADGAAGPARVGLGLLEKLRADDGIRRAARDGRAQALPFDKIEAVAQRRRVIHERAVVDIDGRLDARLRLKARLSVSGGCEAEAEAKCEGEP